jgi:general L-amino acid transport system permease protein
MTSTKTRELARPPFWRDVRVIRVVGQVAAVIAVFFILRYFYGNLVDNFNRLGIALDFQFLQAPTNFQVPFHPEFEARSPVWSMVLVGVKNTFLAGFFGIIIASVVGLVVGVSRLSENWLIARLATLYVEFFRNIPPLVVIIFFGFAVFFYGPFPLFAESWELGVGGNNLLILNKDRWGIPGYRQVGNLTAFWIVMVVGVVVTALIWRWRTRVFDKTGHPHHRVVWSGLCWGSHWPASSPPVSRSKCPGRSSPQIVVSTKAGLPSIGASSR